MQLRPLAPKPSAYVDPAEQEEEAMEQRLLQARKKQGMEKVSQWDNSGPYGKGKEPPARGGTRRRDSQDPLDGPEYQLSVNYSPSNMPPRGTKESAKAQLALALEQMQRAKGGSQAHSGSAHSGGGDGDTEPLYMAAVMGQV